MLPEFQSKIQNTDRVLLFSDSLQRSGPPSRETVSLYAEYIYRGIPAIACIAHDEYISNVLDRMPVSFAVREGIPVLERALTVGSYSDVTAILSFESSEESWQYSERRDLVAFYKKARVLNNKTSSFVQEYRSLGINVILGSLDCFLSLSHMPEDMYFIKTFEPSQLIRTWHDQETFEAVQLKLTNEPFVSSLYVDGYSVSYYGVGVRIQPRTLYAAFTTDVGSGETTNMHTPDIRNHKQDPQLMDWDSARRCAKIAFAHRFNLNQVWYPEVWSDTGKILSVVVRPYDSFVANSAVMGNGFRDGDRAIAATMFAKALGVPIEVLE